MAIRLTNPLPGGIHTDRFGWRPPIPAAGIYAWNFHNGTDLAAPAGTPIRAAHSGRVTGVFYDHDQGGGWMVRIGAAFGYTLYGHMREQSPYVRLGDEVKAGQTIGHVGATGAATGNHLHWILHLNGTNVDPLPYLKSTTPTIPKNPKPIPEEEEDDMAKNSGFYYKPDKDTVVYLIVNPVSGFVSEYGAGKGRGGMGGTYNNPVARAFDTGSYAEITASHAAEIKRACAEVRAAK